MVKRVLRVCLLLCAAAVAPHCAAQGGAPLPLSASQRAVFDGIAQDVPNPCAPGDGTLASLLRAGKSCRGASILSSDIVFFMNSGVEPLRISGMVSKEARGMQSPQSFDVAGRARLGQAGAPVEIVIFSDFQCPYCARAAQTVGRVYEARPGAVTVVFKHMPLTGIHPYAAAAAVIGAYAQSVGRFWEIHDRFFASQQSMGADFLNETMALLGVDKEVVFDPVKGQPYGVVVVEDMADARRAGVEGTPTVFVNGVEISGASHYERLLSLVDAIVAAQEGQGGA